VRIQQILENVSGYYGEKVQLHGPNPRGADWNSAQSQEARFHELIKVHRDPGPFSIIDYGCGYGAFYAFLQRRGLDCTYVGYDVSLPMISLALQQFPNAPRALFTGDESTLVPADYTIASGIMHVKLDTVREEWEAYVFDTIDRLARLSKRAFAFNLLTSYSDPDLMRPDLYYADPCFFFHHCKTRYSKWVALLHDYGLYEFTIQVYKGDQAEWLT